MQNKIDSSRHFNPETAFFDLPIIRITLLIGLLLISCLIAIIGIADPRGIDVSADGFNELVLMFKFPIGLLAFFAALLALFATNHRSEQNKKSMSLSQAAINATGDQNRFANYYKHLEELANYLDRHLNNEESTIETINISRYFISVKPRVNLLYSKMYPQAKVKGISFSEELYVGFFTATDRMITAICSTDIRSTPSIANLIVTIDDSLKTFLETALDDSVKFTHDKQNLTYVMAKFSDKYVMIPEARLGRYLEMSAKILEIIRDIFCFDETFDEHNFFRDSIAFLSAFVRSLPDIGVSGDLHIIWIDGANESEIARVERLIKGLSKFWLNQKSGCPIERLSETR